MPDTNVQIVQRLYDAFKRRDQAAVFALIAPDIEVAQSTALPWGGKYTGADGLRQFLGSLLQHVDSNIEVERFIDAGDHVVAIGRVKGTVRANQRSFDVPIAHVWRIQSGRINAFFPYIENAAMLTALNG